jgi:hypothetical protein
MSVREGKALHRPSQQMNRQTIATAHRGACRQPGRDCVERGIRKAVLTAQFPNRSTSVYLFQKPNNLLIRKPLLHVRSPLEKRTLLDPHWHVFLEAHQEDSLFFAKSPKIF